jgi:hypothetical protein
MSSRVLRRLGACVLWAGLAFSQAGCLFVAAGVAGGAAAGYCYSKGKVCQEYRADLLDAWQATRAALHELGMPLTKETRDGREGLIESRTGDGERVRILLEMYPSRIPADGNLTRICVRVATFGDHPLSGRILDQVSRHLVPTDMVYQPAAQPVVPPAGSPQTAPPPLLPPEPVPVQPK